MSDMALEFDSTHPFFQALINKAYTPATGAYPKVVAGICIEGVIAPAVLCNWDIAQTFEGTTVRSHWALLKPQAGLS